MTNLILLFPFLFGTLYQTIQGAPNPPMGHGAHKSLEVSPQSVVHLTQCLEKFLYEHKAPSTVNMPREQLVQFLNMDKMAEEDKKDVTVPKERTDIKVTAHHKNAQMNYFLEPHYAIAESIHKCIAQTKDLASVQTKIFEETGFTKWVEEEKKQLAKEYSRIGTTGFFYGNRGSRDFGKRKNRSELLFKFWRRLPISHGLAVKSAYFWLAQDLIEKILGQMHGNQQSNALGLISLQKIISHELANYNQILTYTYHNYYMEHRSNWEKNQKVYFDSEYNKYKAGFAHAMPNVHVSAGHANLEITMPKVKKVIWVVRSVQKRSWQEDKYKQLGAALQKAFQNVKIDQLYVTEGEKEEKNSENLAAANFILASGKHANIKELKKVNENNALKRIYVRGSPGTGDDDDLWSVEDIFTRILEGKNDGKENVVAKAATGDKDVVMEDVQQESKSEHAHPHKAGSSSEPIADAELGLVQAPGEEHAENIVVVTDLGASIALQQVFNGAYKYAAQGSITKLVELPISSSKSESSISEHSGSGKEQMVGGEKEPPLGTKGDALRQRIRLIFAGDTAHLGKLREDKAFMGVYWTK